MDTKLRREKRGTITSALMGAAGGALLGHLAKGISPSFDAKKGAMLGAALGGGYGYYSSRTRTTTAFPDYGINSQ
ncbi:hypothetical protein RvY_18029 [Ramazzottius varieornatus]|uniref:YMGG-like Gly-zipper domain-containing protein n=1 Tax=Ramazzottius varieornatus TaxID=947166 RepID=A0A1D1W4X7_RAMVA|nr:hypothetical protein RvY_18029 [Ramazzottius varieornatus]